MDLLALTALALEWPEALRWWLRDWAAVGNARFGISTTDSFKTAKAAAVGVESASPARLNSSIRLMADHERLVPDAALSKDQWIELGGFIFLLMTDIKMLDEA